MATTDDPSEEQSQTTHAVRVLIVDDEVDLLLALRGTLRRAGYIVRTASSAERGLALLEQEPAELVITDIIMPRQSGIDVIGRVRELYPATRVIAMSGGGKFAFSGYRPDAITTSAYLMVSERAGAHAVLPKPFEASEILAVVRQVLSASPQET
jgi:two-component system, cell cycle response regulator CpdR